MATAAAWAWVAMATSTCPRRRPSRVGGYGFYTPGVVTSGDLDDGYEFGVRARYAFTPNVDGYVGLRQAAADFDNRHGNRTLDRGAQVGVRLSF
jgi:predicted porin